MRRLGAEAQEWSKQAGLLLNEATSDHEETKDEEQKKKDKSETEEGAVTKELPEVMNIIGMDDNIHPKSLQQAIDEVGQHCLCITGLCVHVTVGVYTLYIQTETAPIASSEELGLATEQSMYY